jgi:multidrug resistance efflux pump
MDRLPPIPSPPEHHWREFRIRVMPGLMFALAVLAAAYIWNQHVFPPTLIGEVEAIRANVTTITPGYLANLKVDLFQKVSKDQEIGTVLIQDVETTRATLSAIGAELGLMRARMGIDQQRNALNYEQFRMDLLNQRLLLGEAQLKLQEATTNLTRITGLLSSGIASAAELDAARTRHDVLKADVTDRTSLIGELEQRLKELRPAGSGGTNDPVTAAIEAQEAELRALQKPVVLTSPIDGVVSMIYRRPGEKVLAGEPIVTISASAPCVRIASSGFSGSR